MPRSVSGSSESSSSSHDSSSSNNEERPLVPCRLRSSGANYRISHPSGAEHVNIQMEESAPNPQPQSPPSFWRGVRSFFSSMSPMSHPGMTRPRFRCPRTHNEYRAVAMGVLGLTSLGAAANILAGLYASYRAHNAHMSARRPPAPAPAAGHPAAPRPTTAATETTSAQTSQSSTQATTAQQSTTPPATSGDTQSTISPLHSTFDSAVASTSTHHPSTPPNPTFDAFDRDIMAEIQQELAHQQAYVRTAPQVPVTSPTPSPFRQLNGQIICEPAGGHPLDLHVSWRDSNQQYVTKHIQCTKPQVLQIPNDARNITVEGAGYNFTEVRLLWARVGPSLFETCGWPNSVNMVRMLMELTSGLRQAQEWSAVQQVTEHILEQASGNAPPDFMAQMEALNYEATLHMDAENAHAAALAGMGMAAVGVAGAYTAYQLYRGYREGMRGWDLFTYPMYQAANSLGLLPPPEYEIVPAEQMEMQEVRVDVPQQEPAQAHVEAPAAAALQNPPPPPPPPLPIDDDEGFGEDDDLALFAQQRVQQWLQEQHHHLVAAAPEQNNDDNEHSSDED